MTISWKLKEDLLLKKLGIKTSNKHLLEHIKSIVNFLAQRKKEETNTLVFYEVQELKKILECITE
jgi:hypothetical protein